MAKSGPTVPGFSSAAQVGPRVFLRHPAGRDLTAYLKLRDDSRDWLEPWEPSYPDGRDPFTEQAFHAFITNCDTETCKGFVICDVATGDIIGKINLNNITRGAFQSTAVGYWIAHACAGRGYMTEALALAIRHAFDTLGLHRVEANIIPTNAPSLALVKKLGFRFEGLALRYLKINGRWQDHQRWAITTEDPQPTLSKTRP